jgi:hypothetical protein
LARKIRAEGAEVVGAEVVVGAEAAEEGAVAPRIRLAAADREVSVGAPRRDATALR